MDDLDKSGIYKILNIISGKIYVGSALNILSRWRRHRTHANGNYHHSITFQRAWNKYGKEAFNIEILEYCDKDNLAEREQFWLDLLKPYDINIGYNIYDSSTTQVGMKRSKQAKENMRQAQLGSIRTQEHRDAIGAANRNLDKWPHLNGSNCKCLECKEKRTTYAREHRWAEENNKPYKGRKFDKWPCPDGQKCKCYNCKQIKNEAQRERRLNKLYG